MANPSAAMLVIGDEILSGRTRDANMYHLAGVLFSVGIDLVEVRIVQDQAKPIIAALHALRQQYQYVFTSGGIGPTHDDITADCVAEAFGVGIDVRADAWDILAAYYTAQGKTLNEGRLRMARIPDTAQLILNPVSGAPGFILENVYVMAGVPSVFQAMLAGILPDLTVGIPFVSRSVRLIYPESLLAFPLKALVQKYPDLSVGCYPFEDNGQYGAHIVVRGIQEDMMMSFIDELLVQFPPLQTKDSLKKEF